MLLAERFDIPRAVLVLAVCVVTACGGDDPAGHEHEDVFRVGVAFGPDEIAPGGHVPINTGGSANRIGLNLYSHHGNRITVVDHFQITLAFAPGSLATATAVAGTTTFFDITSSAAQETGGTMTITVYHPHSEETKTFGPYDVLIH